MKHKKKISVLICTYNEFSIIPKLIQKLLKIKCIDDIVVVDDYYDHKTQNFFKKNKNKKIQYFSFSGKRSLTRSFLFGCKKTKNENILRFDADMYNDIKYFKKFFHYIEKNDIIIFSRYIKNGLDQRSFKRKVSSYILNLICRTLLSDQVNDYTSFIILFKKKIVKKYKIIGQGYGEFIIKFIFDMILEKKIIKEIPYVQKKNSEKNSKSYPNFIRFFLNGIQYLKVLLYCCFIKCIKPKILNTKKT